MTKIFCKRIFGLPIIFWCGGLWFIFGTVIDSTANIVIGAIMINFGVMELMFKSWGKK
jgi:hypothetical protein